MGNPSKIKEGGVVYSLGEFDGKQVEYDFSKVLTYLDTKGKLLLGRNFRLIGKVLKNAVRRAHFQARIRSGKAVPGRRVKLGILLGCGCLT